MPDSRFTALSTDPRYRLPNRKAGRTAVDARFKRLFKDEDFRQKARVDRYGRQVTSDRGKKELDERFRLDEEDLLDGSEEAREVGSSEGGSDAPEAVTAKRDPARDGGFDESSSDEESTSDEEESADEAELAAETAGQEQAADVPTGEVSARLAVVNLDWDNIRATDIMAVALSFVPRGEDGIESVKVYPSEFGRERMEREELEGPPREIFASSKRGESTHNEIDDDEDVGEDEEDEKIQQKLQHEQVDDGSEFDTAQLRQYQLERLRYHYAIISCDSKATAKALYDAMDGREYLSTSNFFDLRFIPDDTSFEDDTPTEACTHLPPGYKPNEFRTEALTHSKVRLTWDDDDATRKEVQKRAFSRAELDENDLQAYIGSDESDADSVSSRRSATAERKAKKKEAERAKMRAALGLSEEPVTKKGEVVGDMQITFTSGIGGESGKDDENRGVVFENEPQDEESTRQRYIRKEKERKQKRKEKMKAGGKPDTNADEDNENDEDDQGFDDPFFTDPSASAAIEKKAKKADRQKKLDAQIAKDKQTAEKAAELDLLMADDRGDDTRHFDMREIERAQKEAKRRNRKKSQKHKPIADATGDAFKVETQDPRFRQLFESHEFAIDPTNPRFKGTDGMKALLEEGRRKRKVDGDENVSEKTLRDGKKSKKSKEDGDVELTGLVARLGGGGKKKKTR